MFYHSFEHDYFIFESSDNIVAKIRREKSSMNWLTAHGNSGPVSFRKVGGQGGGQFFDCGPVPVNKETASDWPDKCEGSEFTILKKAGNGPKT